MTDPNISPIAQQSSSRKLFRSTLIAAAVAVVLLATVVLPAEYGVDPTGVGRVLGLTKMGEIKASLAREAALADSLEASAPSRPLATAAAPPITPTAPPIAPSGASNSVASTHVTEIVLPPGEGKEIKLVMRKDARVGYSWAADRGVVNYDTHGDAPGIKYHGYAKGSGKASDEGELVAAFDGAHGWFWRNRGNQVVTVTLRTSGEYQELKRM